MSSKKRGLGKGLSALLENAPTDVTNGTGIRDAVTGGIAKIAIQFIETNPFQPRTHFEEDALEELCTSIKEHGIIQPLTVRKLGPNKFQLISGERRFRASQLAGLKEVPAYIRIANDQSMLEMAIVENVQREDLNAIEVAISYQRLIEECDLTQEQLSQKVAKSRSAITNHLRLLKLPPAVQLGIRDNLITMGHARAIVSADSEDKQLAIYAKVLEDNLSVRDVEQLIKSKGKTVVKATSKPEPNKKITALESNLSEKLDTSVNIKANNNGKGKLVINFNSQTDLDRILKMIK